MPVAFLFLSSLIDLWKVRLMPPRRDTTPHSESIKTIQAPFKRQTLPMAQHQRKASQLRLAELELSRATIALPLTLRWFSEDRVAKYLDP